MYEFLNQDNKEMYAAAIKKEYLSQKSLTVDIVENGIILPCVDILENGAFKEKMGGVIRDDGSFVENSGLYRTVDYTLPKNIIKNGYIPGCKVDFIDKTVIYGGTLTMHWGHFLLEDTSRLYYYLKNKPKNTQLVFTPYLGNLALYDTQKEFFELLDIDFKDIIILEKPTKFSKVIVPEHSTILDNYYTEEFMVPYNIIKNKVNPAKNKKNVYFSRTKFKRNANTIGEEEIENFFKSNGFEIVYPETLTLKEQISIIKGCEIFVALNGSACHNLLFADKSIKVAILNRFNHLNIAQFMVDNMAEIKTEYIDIYNGFLEVTHGDGPFWVEINENLFNFLDKNNIKYKSKKRNDNKNNMIEYLIKWSSTYNDINKFNYIKDYDVKKCVKDFTKAISKNTEECWTKRTFWQTLRQYIKQTKKLP